MSTPETPSEATDPEDRRKHLEFIQATVSRMGSNSFLLKGWAVTVVAALLVLAGKDGNPRFVVIALLPVPLFAGLDAYYLGIERQYRALFRKAAGGTRMSPFDMDASGESVDGLEQHGPVLSKTIWVFYLGLVAVVLAVFSLAVCWD